MILNILKQTLFLLMILFSGINFFKLFRIKSGLAEELSSGFMLGIGLTTFGLFLLGFIGYKFNFQNVFIFLVTGNLILILVNKIILKNKYSLHDFFPIKFFKNLDLFEKVSVGGIGFFLLTSIIRNLYWPIWMWDAVQMYDYRAKLIVTAQSIFFSARSFYDISYPLLTSLMHSILYVAGSTNPKFIYTLIFLSLIFGVYAFAKNLTNKKVGLALAFLISFYPLFYDWSVRVSSNLIQSTFLVLGTLYLVKWLSREKINYLVLGSLFFVFSRFTRNEPIWMAALVFLIIYLLVKRLLFKKRYLVGLLIFLTSNYFVGYASGKYLSYYSFEFDKLRISQFSFVTKLSAYLYNFSLKTISDSFVMVFNSVILDMLIPILFICVFLYLTKLKMGKEVSLLLLFCLFYLLIFFGGTIFYRLISSYTDFSALGGSLDKFSIFWKVLVLISTFLVIFNFYRKLSGGIKY